MRGSGINSNDSRFLELLTSSPPGLRFRDFQKLGMNDKTIREILNRLKDAGYVKKSDASHRPIYTITSAGKTAFVEMGRPILDQLRIEGEAKKWVDGLGVEKAWKIIRAASKEAFTQGLAKGGEGLDFVDKDTVVELQEINEELRNREKLWQEHSEKLDDEESYSPELKKLIRAWLKNTSNGNSGPPRFVCPECGDCYLSLIATADETSGELEIRCTCESCDYVGFKIFLGIMWHDLKHFKKRGALFDARLFNLVKPEIID